MSKLGEGTPAGSNEILSVEPPWSLVSSVLEPKLKTYHKELKLHDSLSNP